MNPINFENIAPAIVGIFALFLVLVGVMGLARPTFTKSFFGGFASNVSKHYIEIAVRIIVGTALIVHAGSSAAPNVLRGLGWILILTSTILAVIPWRWHKNFAQKSVARAMCHLALLSGTAIILGVALFLAAFPGVTR